MADAMVKKAQEWYNETYRGTDGYVEISEDGITGSGTCKAFVRALQYELGLDVDGGFGTGTLNACPTIDASTSNKNLITIVQCGFYCKGYNPNGIDGAYGSGAKSAALNFKRDIGFDDPGSSMEPVFIQALLNTDSFKLSGSGNVQIREAQQYLNANYIEEFSFLKFIPTTGIADRNMSKAVIAALQYEEAGKKLTGVDGIYGTNTLNNAPELKEGSSKKEFIKIAKMCLMIMYSYPDFTEYYDELMAYHVEKFQEFYCLTKESSVTAGVIGKVTWASLLSSKGFSERKAEACDTSKQLLTESMIKKLKDTGYKIVGRYLTGTVGGTTPKNLTEEELKLLADNNMRCFPIYQDGGASVSHFTPEKGTSDAQKAIAAATALHIPANTIIYFAVDVDVTADQTKNSIIPYFRSVREVFENSDAKYRVGIYGARNVCSMVCKEELASSSFVSDMSTGYSGNLGFPLPDNWAFDQFYEYSVTDSSGVKIPLDKNIFSGRDEGFMPGEMCGGENYRDCTQHSMVLQDDLMYLCPNCEYEVKSPFLQDNDILSEAHKLQIKTFMAFIAFSDIYPQAVSAKYSMCEKMAEIRSNYPWQYEYHDLEGKCLIVEPEGDYVRESRQILLYEPVLITEDNIDSYNGFFDTLIDTLFGILVPEALAFAIYDAVKELTDGNKKPTMLLILQTLCEKAGMPHFAKCIEIAQIGSDIEESTSSSKVEIGDTVVDIYIDFGKWYYVRGVFDPNNKLKIISLSDLMPT